ncbi:MAG: hypothetical protein L3J13_10200 [Devosiaceae bacterium]|nr:hypothetical protein [Devosiaceae bacterium]
MSLLTNQNFAALGLGVFSVVTVVGALPFSGSAALAQSQIITNVSSALGQTRADQNTPSKESLSRLLRVGERTYQVDFDPSISSDVVSSSVVQKIAFGNETYVSIVATSSGTYSTDGFASNHVLYPGVSVAEVHQNDTGLQVLIDGQFVDWSTVLELLAESRL